MTDKDLIKVNTPDDVDLEKIQELLEEPPIVVPDVVGSTYCLVCGSEIPVGWHDSYVKICDDCKKAVMFVKEHFRYED